MGDKSLYLQWVGLIVYEASGKHQDVIGMRVGLLVKQNVDERGVTNLHELAEAGALSDEAKWSLHQIETVHKATAGAAAAGGGWACQV